MNLPWKGCNLLYFKIRNEVIPKLMLNISNFVGSSPLHNEVAMLMKTIHNHWHPFVPVLLGGIKSFEDC